MSVSEKTLLLLFLCVFLGEISLGFSFKVNLALWRHGFLFTVIEDVYLNDVLRKCE